MYLCIRYKKKSVNKRRKKLQMSLKSLKKGVGSGVGSEYRSEFISQRYGFSDPDLHQTVTDHIHCNHIRIFQFGLIQRSLKKSGLGLSFVLPIVRGGWFK
jgi:hypothetical protein